MCGSIFCMSGGPFAEHKNLIGAIRMDDSEEKMTPNEMLEKIAELDYSQSQLRELNAEMRHWLEVADEEMATLRSDNASLIKQVKILEKTVHEAQQVEAEPHGSLPADNLAEKRCSENKIQTLEKEATMMKEENMKLTAEHKRLQQERDQHKISLSKLKITLQILECGIEDAQVGLKRRDDVIHQKSLELKHLEQTVEECSNIIKDLRLKNQELRNQLEDSLDQASLATLNDQVGEKEGSLGPPLTFAEEIQLLASSAVVKTSGSGYTDLRHDEAAELLKPQSLTAELYTRRCADMLNTAVQRVGLFLLFIFILTISVLMPSLSCAAKLLPIDTFWTCTRMMLQPYCHVHYEALPPI